MNTFPLKKSNLIPLSKDQSPNEKAERSNKREISIIQEVKEKTPKKMKNINKSTLDFKNIRTMNVHKMQKNKSVNFFNFKQKLIPLGNEQKNKLKNILNNENDRDKNKKGKEFYNKLSLERINFQFEEYGEYPNDDFQPSIYFFKFLANKPDYEKENQEKGKACTSKLKLFIPDTIVLNDLDTNYWIYTDIEGFVNRIEESDNEVIEKFKPQNDKNELIAVSKIPIMRDGILGENQLTLLNLEELEKCLFSKSGSQIAIQRFVKCRGPRAFLCRSVWRRDKPPYVYILTNKANYLDDEIKNQYLKFVINSKEQGSYSAFYSSSGKHLEETMAYMNNIVKFIEGHSDIIFDELAGDFVKDEAGIWWFINLKAMKIKNISKFRRGEGNPDPLPPQLNFFFNQRIFSNVNLKDNVRKFDYQNKIKCKLCGIDYSKKLLKYELTTKMIIETENMLRHVEFNKVKFNVLDRPDLRHTYYSMIYLPYRVCEDCYLLFETLNDIKDYQIEIANLFKIPVDKINFCFNYYTQIKEDKSKVKLTKKELKNIEKMNKEIINMNSNFEDIIETNEIPRKTESDNEEMHNESSIIPNNDSKRNYYNHLNKSKSKNEEQEKNSINENNQNENLNGSRIKKLPTLRKNNSMGQIPNSKNISIITNNESNKSSEIKKPKNLYRILIMFNDILWNNIEEMPLEELYIIYSFLGNRYKIPLKIEPYIKDLDYTIINFQKIYHIVCTEPEGFINFVEKNRYMEVKLGTFQKTDEETKKKEVQKLLRKNITIEDQDIVGENEQFRPYAGLDLSIQGLKYGTNYRNNLNGLLFKKDKPYYIGKLRCVIRIHKVKEISDINKYVLSNYYNLLIPPVHFVVSDEMPDYWIEIIERQKIRKKIINEVIECMKKYKIKFDKKNDKKRVMQAIETLVSYYAKNSA
jgi:LMBR1 domain-containing protein 1